jgi:glycosyltransferase involved in cell wall biosynthesis
MSLITVFTPTFNRVNKLSRVYESLQQQTFKDFEWIIVDDGSTDNTETLIQQWQKNSNTFSIRYFFQQNSGKHIAINYGVQQANGVFFIIADSDDRFVPEALEELYNAWNAIPEKQKPDFSNVWCLCKDEKGKIIGNSFPENTWDAYYYERKYVKKIRGEKWNMEQTAILKMFPFPDIHEKGLSHLPEGIVWNRIGEKYKTRHINKCLRIYYSSQDGLIQSPDKPTKFLTMWIENRSILAYESNYMHLSILYFLKGAFFYLFASLNIPKKRPPEIFIKRFKLKVKIMLVFIVVIFPLLFGFYFLIKKIKSIYLK